LFTQQRRARSRPVPVLLTFNNIGVGFDDPDIGVRVAASGLTGTCQFTLTGLGSWLVTFKQGVHTTVRCNGTCDPPPDATFTCSPETYLRVKRRVGGLDAETALQQGLITIGGDWGFALAVVGESY
jgi:hypothetical protein